MALALVLVAYHTMGMATFSGAILLSRWTLGDLRDE
jgi:hypothetical protein